MHINKFLSSGLLRGGYKREFIFNLSMMMVLSFIIISIRYDAVWAEDTMDKLTPKEINELIPQIQEAERRFENIRVESEEWVETRASLSDNWQRTPIYCSVTAWLKPDKERKVRVDVHKEVLKWIDGTAPYGEESYSASYDGHIGKTIFYSTGPRGKAIPIKEGRIVPTIPEKLRLKSTDSCIGSQFTLQFFFSEGEQFSSFSELFRVAISPDALKANVFEITREEFQGSNCIKFNWGKQDWGNISYWLDPPRGFAFLGYDNVARIKDGRDRVVSRIRVQQVKEVIKNVWWPIEATIESDPREPNSPYQRTVYRALNVVANDPNFDNSVFTLNFPKGYRVDDKITGKKYVVDSNNN